MTAIRNFDLPDGISDKITGTTSDSYEDALSWTCYGLAGKTISIKNTHSSNALKYKILTYIYPGGTSFTEVGETSLSAGSSAKHTIGYPCARVIVQVKSGTAGNAATYQIEYTGNRFASQSELDNLKQATLLAAKDLVILVTDPPIVVASGDEISVNDLTIEAGARCYVYGVLRVFGENFIKGELNIIGDVEFAGGV